MIHYSGSIDDPTELIRFLRREADSLRALRRLIIFQDRTVVQDINKDGIEFPGLTYGSPVLERLLQELGVVFDARALQDATSAPDGKTTFDLSSRWTWGHDRVL